MQRTIAVAAVACALIAVAPESGAVVLGEQLEARIKFSATLETPERDFWGFGGQEISGVITEIRWRDTGPVPLVNIGRDPYTGEGVTSIAPYFDYRGFSPKRFTVGGQEFDRPMNDRPISVSMRFPIVVTRLQEIIDAVFNERDLSLVPDVSYLDLATNGTEDFDVVAQGHMRYAEDVVFASKDGPVVKRMAQIYDFENIDFEFEVVPLPAALPMFVAGVGALALYRRVKRRQAA